MNVTIRRMIKEDIERIAETFESWGKPRDQYEKYWRENQECKRVTLVAVVAEEVVGYANVVWHSDYEPFCLAGVPEIQDLNVTTQFQQQGIGTALIKQAESLALEHGHQVLGIGVGMTSDYAAAQRLYPRLGYVPDGRGTHSTPWGDEIYLLKSLT